MSDFFFARSQMAMSLAFHILFAALGMGMPVLMAVAEGLYLRTGQPVYLELAKRWAKGTAILFAVGAVSGTVLSFELGLLWPGFMDKAGAIIGMPFSLEGFAFFMEAIFLGLFLYGWKRLTPFVHWLMGIMVAVSGIFSGGIVVTANAWMNAPAGFKLVDGQPVDIDPLAAMFNAASYHEVLHMTIAAFVTTGFAVAAVHAFFLLRDRQNLFHRRALGIALAVAAISAPMQLWSGDQSSKAIAQLQPIKFAATEANYHTQTHAPLLIGGIPNDDTQTTEFALRIPDGLSLLLAHDPDAKVTGLADFPKEEWPNVRIVHWAFDIMVGAGMFLILLSVAAAGLWWKTRQLPDAPWFLLGLVASGPLGFIAMEAGWVVTEVGRQPWIIYGIMRTEAAVTPMPGLVVPFTAFTLLYLFLAVVVVFLLRGQFLEAPGSAAKNPG